MSVEIPLRERKAVTTRLSLANGLVKTLDKKPLSDISVRELCELLPISEATFFNYFTKKTDLLAYAVQLLVTDIVWSATRKAGSAAGLALVQGVFDQAAHHFQNHPGLVGEIIAMQASATRRPEPVVLTAAEKQLAFPSYDGIGDQDVPGLDAVMVKGVQNAIEQGELPVNTPLNSVMVALISIFYGVPLALRLSSPATMASMYKQQLVILWSGLQGATAGRQA